MVTCRLAFPLLMSAESILSAAPSLQIIYTFEAFTGPMLISTVQAPPVCAHPLKGSKTNNRYFFIFLFLIARVLGQIGVSGNFALGNRVKRVIGIPGWGLVFWIYFICSSDG